MKKQLKIVKNGSEMIGRGEKQCEMVQNIETRARENVKLVRNGLGDDTNAEKWVKINFKGNVKYITFLSSFKCILGVRQCMQKIYIF